MIYVVCKTENTWYAGYSITQKFDHMSKQFFKNITKAFRSAGWLMVGTALMIWVGSITIGVSEWVTQWGYGSVAIGVCFLVSDIIISFFARDKI